MIKGETNDEIITKIGGFQWRFLAQQNWVHVQCSQALMALTSYCCYYSKLVLMNDHNRGHKLFSRTSTNWGYIAKTLGVIVPLLLRRTNTGEWLNLL